MTKHSTHRRFNHLTGEWILVSPQRTQRPWQGQIEKMVSEKRPEYDETCYLCPGNKRAGENQNPKYQSTFVFTNDFASLNPFSGEKANIEHPLLNHEEVSGTCRVMCFSPRHNLTLAQMGSKEMREVIDLWANQVTELGKQYCWVQVFENKGAIMGCSNAHPHGQIWASSAMPEIPTKEDKQQKAYYNENGHPLLLDYVELEVQKKERIVVENQEWAAIIPYWASWPFEILLIPRRHVLYLPQLDESSRHALVQILKQLLTRYDNLFQTSFPYSMGWHGAPTGIEWNSFTVDQERINHHWQLHAHFFPPLLRSAAIKKFMVGYEMLAEPQRDLTAEEAAKRLREVSEVHYAG